MMIKNWCIFYILLLCTIFNINHIIAQDTIKLQFKDTNHLTRTQDTILKIKRDSSIATTRDTISKKVYKKKIAPIIVDTPFIDSNNLNSIKEANIETIDTANLLSLISLYDLIPFINTSNNQLDNDTEKYIGKERADKQDSNDTFNIYAYAYIFLFFLAIGLNIFQNIGSSKNYKVTTQKDFRYIQKKYVLYHLITLIFEGLFAIGLVAFFYIYGQLVISSNTIDFKDIKNFIFNLSFLFFLFLVVKHLIVHIIQEIFWPKYNRIAYIYYYQKFLMNTTLLLFISTCIAFFIHTLSIKTLLIQITIILAIILYIRSVIGCLINIKTTHPIRSMMEGIFYLCLVEFLSYLLFFKYLSTNHYFLHIFAI